MPLSRHKYRNYILLSLALSTGIHLLLALVPHPVREWIIGPARLPVPAPRLEVIVLARQPVPRYLTSASEPSPAGRKAVVPPKISPRPRPTAADSAVRPLLAETPFDAAAALQEELFAPASREKAGTLQADSTFLVREYISTVLDRVRNRRRYPEAARRLGQEGEVLLAFSINRQGLLDGEVELLGPCPFRLLNRSACRSIERSAPFPPLPAPVLDNSLSFKVKLLYRLAD